MAHTIKVIVAGFVLLAGCLLIGRIIGGAISNPSMGVSRAALVFIPLWAVAAFIWWSYRGIR